MRNLLTICVLGTALTACLDDEGFSGVTATVFEYGPNQCFANSDTALRQSAMRLRGAGIEVGHSSCGMTTYQAYPAVVLCGVPNGSIWLHDIPARQVPVAEANGFTSADQLPKDPETGQGWRAAAECK